MNSPTSGNNPRPTGPGGEIPAAPPALPGTSVRRRRALIAAGVGAVLAAGATGVALSVSSSGAAAAAPEVRGWPAVNRDYDNTRAVPGETAIDATTVTHLKQAWQITGLKGQTGTPAVVDGVVYFGAWDGTVRAVDEQTGRQVWKTSVISGTGMKKAAPSHGNVSGSVAVAGGKVYAGVATGAVVALDQATGKPVWSWPGDSYADAQIWSSPVLVDGHVVIGTGSIEVGSLKSSGFVSRGSVVSLDAQTGAQQWRWFDTDNDATSGAGGTVWSSAAIDTGRHALYIGTGQNVSPPASRYSDSLVALDYTTGKLLWSHQYTAGDVYRIFKLPPNGHDFDLGASPNLFTIDGRDVVGVADKGGTYAVFDRDGGTPVWATHLTDGSHLGGAMQTAAYHDGTIYATSNTWVNESNPAQSGNKVSVFALDAATGKARWRRDLPSPGFGAVTWAGGLVYVPTVTGTLYVLGQTDGTIAAQVKAGPSVGLGGGVSVVDGTVFTGYGASGNGGGLTAYRP